MKLRINPVTKEAAIIGLTPESIGGVSQTTLDAVVARLAAVEQYVLPIDYDLDVSTVSVFSINNSQISTKSGVYDLPTAFTSLALAAGKKVRWDMSALDGASLETRWNEGVTPTSARGIIQKGGLQHVILQELSNRPLVDQALFFQYVRLFVDEIRTYNPNAIIYLMENWAYSTSTNYQTDFTTIYNNYRTIATEKNVKIVPCGTAWNMLRIRPGFTALNPYLDERHPILAGIYLNACVFLKKLFGISPLGNTFIPTGLSSSDALTLQDIANKSLTTDSTYSFKTFTFGAVNIKEGVLIESADFRASSLEVYGYNVNWNNGSASVTNVDGIGGWYSGLGYPVVNSCGMLIYQDATNPIALTGTIVSPQLITGLNINAAMRLAVNDGNYANNSGNLAFAYR